MLNSIKGKLIVLFVVLFVLTLSIVGITVNYQTKQQIKTDATTQTEAIVSQMEDSLRLYLERYASSMQYIAESAEVIDYVKTSNAGEETDERVLEQSLNNYIDLNEGVTSIYATTAETREIKIIPSVELPADFDPTTREWYKKSVENPELIFWSEPYEDAATKDIIVTASHAIKDGSKVIGVMGIDFKLTQLLEMISAVEIGYNGYPFIFSSAGTAIVHPERVNENLMELPFIQEMYEDEDGKGIISYVYNGDNKLLVFETVPGVNWKVGAAFTENDLMVSAHEIRNSIIIISLIALAIAGIFIYFAASKITKPLSVLNATITKVADGDLRVRADIKTKDEIGTLAQHFNDMVVSMRTLLTVVDDSVNNVKVSAESLSAVSEETNASSEQVAVAVNEIAKGATESAEEAENANQLSIQLGGQINDINHKMSEMISLAEKADDSNSRGINQVRDLKASFTTANTFMNDTEQVIFNLENEIKKIENVMTTITEISSQTNLLALNASIEAARAGEHGKGFAVVAEEVRKLAEQSVKATDEVKQTITDIQNGSAKAVDSMNKTKNNFTEQTDVVNKTEQTFEMISALVEKMKEAILFISSEVDQVADSKEEVVGSIHNMAAMAQQAAASCEEVSASTDEQVIALQSVSKSAEQLTELSNELKEIVEKFKLHD